MIRIDISQQTLELLRPDKQYCWKISTALSGPGEQHNSGCTPRGHFTVRIKIGDNCPTNTVFVGRRPTGETYSTTLAQQYPDRDWILTRIIWLTGAEVGKNRGGDVDTLRRYIYIHGTPDGEPMGIAQSHGCIRMRNADIIQLYSLIDNGTQVEIIT